MPTEVQFRRGNTGQNNSFTGAAGELSVNTTNNSLRVHDGSTAGGFEVAKADLSNTTGLGTVSASNVGIGTTIVISSGFQLRNIQSLDATTTTTIESAIAAAPNNFTSLNISGIGTIVGNFNVGTGGTVITAISQVGVSSVGINSTVPTATLDVFGTGKVSSSVTVGSATTIIANSIRIGQNLNITNTGVSFSGVEVINTTGVNFPTGIVTAVRFSGELVGTSVTTVGGLHQNTGIATITKILGDISGSVNAGIATVSARLNVTGIATFSSSIDFAGVSTFYQNSQFRDGVKALFGTGNDLEIYHDGSDSYVADAGGGSLILSATPNIQIQNSSVGIATFGSSALDIVGATHFGFAGIATLPQIKVGSAVTVSSFGLNISGGTHIGVTGIATIQQTIVGSAQTINSGGFNGTNVRVGAALTVVGVSTFSALVNVGVDTSIGIIMTAANGTRYRLFVENSGTLATIAI